MSDLFAGGSYRWQAEVEELREVDVASAAGDGTLFVHVSSNTSRALSFVMHPEALQPRRTGEDSVQSGRGL